MTLQSDYECEWMMITIQKRFKAVESELAPEKHRNRKLRYFEQLISRYIDNY